MSSTINDVAELAGVSKALVSRYLNGKAGVGEQSREKIVKAINALNYTPNALARSLATQKTYSIGVLMELLDSDVALSLLRGLEMGVEQAPEGDKYTLIYTSSFGDVERKKRQLAYLTQGRVDGVIIFGSQVCNDDLIIRLSKTYFPFVLIENDLSAAQTDRIVVDNVGGAFAATQRLIELGHRRIAHIAGNMNLKITVDRMQGYINALQYHNMPVDRNLIVFPDFSALPDNRRQPIGWEKVFVDQGYVEMKRMLENGLAPDAVFFPTDFLAFGAIKALEEAGLRVPEDISLIGFDNEIAVAARMGTRPITSMQQPLEEAGYHAVQLCLRRVEDPRKATERIVLKTELKDHGTVCARKNP